MLKPHPFNLDVADEIEFSEETITMVLEEIEEGEYATDDLERIADLSTDLIALKYITGDMSLEDDIEAVYRNLYLLNQAILNLFSLGLSKNTIQPIDIDDIEVDANTKEIEPHHLSSKNWTLGFMISLIGREKSALKLLNHVSLDILKREEAKADYFFYSYIAFLQSLDTSESISKLNIVREEITQAKIAPTEYRDCLIQPQLDLWQTVLDNDTNAFNEVLEKAIQKHHQYWSQEKDDDGGESYKCNYPEGFVAMNLVAIASYAYDKGMEITYKSDYLPSFFIEGYSNIDAKVRLEVLD